jgi:alpha-ketoglutarate-dependent taurine dioxygenase
MPIQHSSFGSGYGVLITATPDSVDTGFDSLDKQATLDTLKEAGFVLFRGFKADLNSFSAFVRAISSRVSLDPARSFSGDVAQKVDAGLMAVGLHCENGNSPFLPDLCWFYCQKAAKAGSQTTVCDGYRVWDALSEPVRTLFSAHKITYSRNVEAEKWKKMAFHMLGGNKPEAEINFDDMMGLLKGSTHTKGRLLDDGAIEYSFTVGAQHATLYGERPAFANSLLGPSYNYQKPKITLDNDEPIPDAVMQEVATVSEQMTEEILWQDGDMVLIDNTRVMHGRRAIVDENRTIFNALSFV